MRLQNVPGLATGNERHLWHLTCQNLDISFDQKVNRLSDLISDVDQRAQTMDIPDDDSEGHANVQFLSSKLNSNTSPQIPTVASQKSG